MSRDDFIKVIRDCGQSVIDNAEKIYNNFEFSSNGVEIKIDVDSHSIPHITVVKEFLPEHFVIDMSKR